MNRTLFASVTIALMVAVTGVSVSAQTDSTDSAAAADRLVPTHRQIRELVPQHDGQRVQLNTFCLDREGNILAAVTLPGTGSASREEEGDRGAGKLSGMIQVYSSEGSLVREIPLDFAPTAINTDGSGYIFVAGDAVVARLNPEGVEVQRTTAPNLAGEKDLRALAEAKLKEQRDQMEQTYRNMVDSARKELDERRAKSGGQSDEAAGTPDAGAAEQDAPAAGAEQEPADGDANADADGEEQEDMAGAFAGMSNDDLESMIKSYEGVLKQVEEQFAVTDERIEATIRTMGKINSLGVGDEDLYVTCQARNGFGYDVWRMSRDLQEPKLVKKRLSGCCGQMDIQAAGEHLLIAENTRFRVGIYDRNGKQVRSFGEQDRRGETGFGSCCNPMNIRCCSNGDILTAESSIGTIKRFDSEGNLVATIGRARIGGGCKNVAIGHDEARDLYYMMYEDEGSILVLAPKSAEFPETAEERMAREAAAGLGQKLAGKWTRTDAPAGGGSVPMMIIGGAALSPAAEAEDSAPAVTLTIDASDASAGSTDAAPAGTANSTVDESGETAEVAVVGLSQIYGFSSATFSADGKLVTEGSQIRFGEDSRWQAISQNGNELTVNVENDLVSYYRLVVRFESDDEAEILIQVGGSRARPVSIGRFHRAGADN